jgi:hypothetical protein
MLISYMSVPVLDKQGSVVGYRRVALDSSFGEDKKKSWYEFLKNLRI